MNESTPRSKALGKIALFFVAIFLIISALCVWGVVNNQDEVHRCENQGGFYKSNGGCDLPGGSNRHEDGDF